MIQYKLNSGVGNNRKRTKGRQVQTIVFFNQETKKVEVKRIIHLGNSSIKFK